MTPANIRGRTAALRARALALRSRMGVARARGGAFRPRMGVLRAGAGAFRPRMGVLRARGGAFHARMGDFRSRLRMPGRTVRQRLTLTYAALFLASGAGLLAVIYAVVSQGNSGTVQFGDAGGNEAQRVIHASPGVPGVQYLLRTQASASHGADLHRLLIVSGLALAVMAVVSIGVAWLVADRVLSPLRTITSAARSMSATSLNRRLALQGPDDELKELGGTFDGLLARLERAFDAQRRFVANASHELRTPLARQRTLVEVALADPRPSVESLRAVCERVLAAGQEQERLIEALLTLARSQRGLDRREPVDLRAAADEALRSRDGEARHRGLRMDATLGPASAWGDSRLTERLAANLVDNALLHNVPEGWVRVVTATRGDRAMISVTNSGPPVPPDEISRLFAPFQRMAADRTGSATRAGSAADVGSAARAGSAADADLAPGGPDSCADANWHADTAVTDRHGQDGGLGLGLSIVVAIAAAHDAKLRARPRPTGGLEVEVYFPRPPDGGPPPDPPGMGRRPAKP